MPLSGLVKVIRANDQRKTRIHTERSEILPASAVPAAARNFLRRVRGRVIADEPWIASSASKALDAMIDPSWHVLELGSGTSTSWLARRAGQVTSIESDPSWARQTRDTLAQARIENANVVEVPVDQIPGELARLAKAHFHLVTIDCHETESITRLDCMQAAAPLVRDGGYLVLDDSDRARLQRAPDMLPGWAATRYIGMKPIPLMAIETTIFKKPTGRDKRSQAMTQASSTDARTEPSSVVKVNVGSGGDGLPGWINVDKSPAVLLARLPRVRTLLAAAGVLTEQQRRGFSREVVYGNATKQLCFPDCSVDFVYSSHMIEHLSPEQGRAFLSEVKRILKPGGTIRLATPDLAQLIADYCAADGYQGSTPADRLMSRLHFHRQIEDGIAQRFISRNLSGHWHQWLYDEGSLRALLDQVGFSQFERSEFQRGEFPDLLQIEARPESLFVQARTPTD